jgi:hypothetical protein
MALRINNLLSARLEKRLSELDETMFQVVERQYDRISLMLSIEKKANLMKSLK